ncbi:MAG: ABC transporter ATP-binding protein [Thermodesulfobacteriota bacterium]|nr:ABC transporter ATP-binding protein [Thermodesulfobacteriota bacterium]
MSLTLEGVNKKVGREEHLKDINLEIKSGSRITLLGRTLAGKTSMLRQIAGLDRPTSGRIFENGKDVTGVSVRKRSIAMVYQQFINYPSFTVFDNIASPLKLKGMAKKDIEKKVKETASMLHVESLLARLPAELSGGQQQRIAIARALIKDADILLMDEPLVNLDYKLREELRQELQVIFDSRDAIVVYTTTEPGEALIMGGNVAVLHEGRILQTGPTIQVYKEPDSIEVAKIFSDPPVNCVNGVIDGENAFFDNDVKFPVSGHLKNLARGEYYFGVRSNHLYLEKRDPQDIEIRAKVDLSEINGSETFIHIVRGKTKLVLQEEGIHNRTIDDDILFYISPDKLFVFDKSGSLVVSPFTL